MQSSAVEIGRIVVGFDGSERGRDAVRLGELLARTAGARLDVVCVRRRAREGDRPGEESERLAAELPEPDGDPSLEARPRIVVADSPARALHELAEAEEAALIVLGSSHRAGIGRVVPGGVAARLLSGSPCPVAVAPRGYRPDGLRVIAVGLDGSTEADAALELASALGGLARATLRVVAVGERSAAESPESGSGGEEAALAPDLQSRLHTAVRGLPAELRALPIFARGDPVGELLARAEEGVDLLVLGSRGYGPLKAVLLGSVSAAVLERAPCPVLVMPRTAAGRP